MDEQCDKIIFLIVIELKYFIIKRE